MRVNGYLIGIIAVVWEVAGFSFGLFLGDTQQDDQFAANL
jgi:hypothetical protein